jgi:4-amino-4-deoxy-L-arabinose transferase-like glycosyltransferase
MKQQDQPRDNGRIRSLSPDVLIYLILIAVFLFRIVYAHFLGIAPDEAYYWDWSREPAFGYFDHPPMIAWLILLSRAVFGETNLGVRAAIIVCGFLASVVAYLLLKKQVKKTSSLVLWAILSNSVILFGVGSLLATPDIPLVLFWSVSLLLAYKAIFEKSNLSWILLGVSLGLGFLSKYTFVLFPVSLALFLIIAKDHRAVLASWQPYASLCIAALVWMPNIIWNQQHHWQAILFQFSHGVSSQFSLRFDFFGDYIGGQLGVLSLFPFILLVWAVIVLLKNKPVQSRVSFLLTFCLAPFGFFLFASLQKKVEANWAACAYISGLMLIAVFWENLKPENKRIRRFAVASVAFSVAATAVILWHLQLPFLPLPPQNDPGSQVRGWKELAQSVDAIRNGSTSLRSLPVCTNRYQEASLFGFYCKDHPKTFSLNFGSRDNQYSLWQERRPLSFDAVVFLHSVDDPNLNSILNADFVNFTIIDKALLQQGKRSKSAWGVFTGPLR